MSQACWSLFFLIIKCSKSSIRFCWSDILYSNAAASSLFIIELFVSCVLVGILFVTILPARLLLLLEIIGLWILVGDSRLEGIILSKGS
jgi:hypothetical protein